MYKKLIPVFFSFSILLISCDNRNNQTACTNYETNKFIGNYFVSEFCQQGNNHGVTYATINPSNGVNQNEIIFFNFNNSGLNASAYISCAANVNGYEQIYFRIPNQSLGSSSNTIQGEGYYNEINGYPTLEFSVQLYEFGQSNYCTYTYTKQ